MSAPVPYTRSTISTEVVTGPHDFATVLNFLKHKDASIARSGWDKNMWVAMHKAPALNPLVKLEPFCYIRTPDGKIYPWVTSHQDLFADDWYVIKTTETWHGE